MKSTRPVQVIVVLALLLFCSLIASSGEETTRVEVRKAGFEPFSGAEKVDSPRFERKIYIATEASFTNKDFASVEAVGDLHGEPGLELILTEEAALRMKALSSQWIGKPLAILVNGEVVLAPVVRAVLGERLIVQGRFTMEELERLAANFR
jgi:preprotein translocase subunit SecD